MQPKAFWAFFPKEVEEKLAHLEKGYRNRRPEDIEETVFKVTIRGGNFEMVVDDQIMKRGGRRALWLAASRRRAFLQPRSGDRW